MFLPPEIVQQLNNWAKNDQDITNIAVKNSEFYLAMQTETVLRVGKSNLTPEGLLLLANIVANSPFLIKLSIYNNDIGANAAVFGTVIAQSKSLTTLDISDNNIGANAEAFGIAIAQSKSLATLDMSCNNIGANAEAFGAAITQAKFLTMLSMACNNIGANAEAFGAAIATSQSLASINMNSNDIGANAEAFGAAISTSQSLINLSMYGNDIDANAAHILVKKLANAPNLVIVEGYGEQFNQAIAQKNELITKIKGDLEPFFPNKFTDYVGYHEVELEIVGNTSEVAGNNNCCTIS